MSPRKDYPRKVYSYIGAASSGGPNYRASVYRSPYFAADREYHVRFYTNDARRIEEDYYTTDRADAIATAQAWLAAKLKGA